MKLSDAIRLGAMLRPQAFGTSFDGVGTCAWGAADEAMGVQVSNFMHFNHKIGAYRPEWAWTGGTEAKCPVCQRVARSVASIIGRHLNDTHRWTRERIADWVATIEPQETAHDLQPITNQEQAEDSCDSLHQVQ